MIMPVFNAANIQFLRNTQLEARQIVESGVMEVLVQVPSIARSKVCTSVGVYVYRVHL